MRVLGGLGLLAAFAAGVAAAQQEDGLLAGAKARAVAGVPSDIPRIEVFERLDPDAALAVTDGTLRIVGGDVLIIGDTRVTFSTGRSRFLMTLVGGELITVISGEESEREDGEAWVIGPGQQVELVTGDDSAALNVLEFAPAIR